MSREDNLKIRFKADRAGERLDSFLVRKLDQSPSFKGTLSRAKIQKFISDGQAAVDGIPRKKNFILKSGEEVDIEVPPQTPITLEGEHIDFDILYEDSDIIIVNKPSGVITHPTAVRASGTLINGIIKRGIELAPAGGLFRPGIVHRLDKDTSGALILAKSDRAYYELVNIFKERRIEKYYCAVVLGNLRTLKGSFEQSIGRNPRNRAKMAVVRNGREARTTYKVIERFIGFDFLSLRIFTGRTHQIRVHLSNSGHSILEDTIYGGKKIEQHIRSLGRIGVDSASIGRLLNEVNSIIDRHPGMFLHAQRLVLEHPVTGKKLDIMAPLPSSFTDLLDILHKASVKSIKS